MHNRRMIVTLVFISVLGILAFFATYRVIAGQQNNNKLVYFGGGQAGY